MKNPPHLFWFIVAIITTSVLPLLAYICYQTFLDQSSPLLESRRNITVFPERIYDTVVQIPETSVSFAYPKNGFYDLGAVVTDDKDQFIASPKFSELGGYHVASPGPYDLKKTSKYVTLEIGLRSNKGNKNLEAVVLEEKELTKGTIIEEFNNQGLFENINDQYFFVYKISEQGSTSWEATTVCADGIISISLAYRNDDDCSESAAAYKENDKIFREILEHVNFDSVR